MLSFFTSQIIQKFHLAFSHAEIILQTLNGRDYHGDNSGLNEAGFKVAIVAGLLQQGFLVASEVEVGNGYIDLLVYATSHPTFKFILELKYVRGGFVKSISDRIRAREFGNIYNSSAKETQNLSRALKDLAAKLKTMTDDDLGLVQWYEHKRQLVSVKDKIRNTSIIQLKHYYEEFNKNINEEHHLYALADIGVVNKLKSFSLMSMEKNLVQRI
jgi:hypothetical protein